MGFGRVFWFPPIPIVANRSSSNVDSYLLSVSIVRPEIFLSARPMLLLLLL